MNNTTSTVSVVEIPLYENIVITLVLLFALFANGVLIFLFVRDHRMQTTTNFFVMSHIASEFFASCQGLIITVRVLAKEGKTDVSLTACVVIGFENLFFFYASFLSLTAIAVNRYLAVVKKVHHKITTTKAKGVIAVIWLLSLAASLPWGSIFAGSLKKDHRFLAWLVYCDSSPGIFNGVWEPGTIFSMLWAVLCIGVPIVVLLVCFRCILKSARRNRRQVNVSYNIHHVAADAYARSAFTTLLIIAVYLICNAFIIPLIIYPSSADSDFAGFLFRCIIWLRSATYPVVYTVRNPVYFRILQRNCKIMKSIGQYCPACCIKDDNTTYTTSPSVAPRPASTVTAEIPRKTRTSGLQGPSRDSPLPVNQQIRAWYERKPKMAFTDLQSIPGTSKSSKKNNMKIPKISWSKGNSCQVVPIND